MRFFVFKRGYTLIELLVVMAILGILATAAMPLIELTARRNKERELKQALWEIRRGIDAYKDAQVSGRVAVPPDASGYPPSLAALTKGVPPAQGGAPLYFLRRLPRDPFAKAGLPTEENWGVRSYQSSAEQPKPGADVYDVYSLSDGAGLNGVPYRQW